MREPFDEDASAQTIAKKDSMEGSEMTPATETGSISEEETGGWFGIGSDIKTFARSIAPPIGGFASFIHNSAMTVAKEIASLEREAELETERWREEHYGKAGEDITLHLPWEIPHNSTKLRSNSCDTIYEEDEELMQKIFDLSEHEETFLGRKYEKEDESEKEEEFSFSLDQPRINLIRRLLELDEQLAVMHARLSGRSDVKETAFWRNYFCHCERTRREHLEQKVDVASLDSAASLGSLVPAGESNDEEESYEYVRNSIASPPSSANTVHTDLSVGDMVLVRAELNDLDKSG